MRITRLLVLLALAFAASATFAQSFVQNHYATGNFPYVAVSADIDRDGNPDLIVSNNSNAPYLEVMLGTGGGLFNQGQTIPIATPAVRLVAGDFNGDGYPDVAALEQDSFQIFLSAKNGTLLPQTQRAIPASGVDMVAVQLNENGSHIPDLAITRCSTTCSLELWVNDGTGTKWQETQAISLNHTFANSLVAADFDRDGHDDLAVTNNVSILVFHNNNNGTLHLSQTITPTNTDLYALAAGDIDAQKGPDLVFAAAPACSPDCLPDNQILVFLNDGTGHLTQKQSITNNSDSLRQMKLVDLTGDNRLDLVILNQEIQDVNGSLSWAHYAGGGTFGTVSSLLQLGKPRDLVARDFNLDSRHDFAIPDDGFSDYNVDTGTYIFLNEGSGAYCAAPNSSVLSASLCSIGHTGDTYTFEATSNSPVGVRRMELWVDGHKKYNSPDDRLKYTTTLSSGSHQIRIVAVDQFGATVHLTNTVTAP